MAVPIIAFANADGGTIVIGVSDKTRKIEGVDQHTEKLNELLRIPSAFWNPSVPITSELLPCTDKDGNDNHILLMHIPASSELHANQTDEAFMRVGNKSRKLSFEERIQLMYDKGERYYEDTAVYGATEKSKLAWLVLCCLVNILKSSFLVDALASSAIKIQRSEWVQR